MLAEVTATDFVTERADLGWTVLHLFLTELEYEKVGHLFIGRDGKAIDSVVINCAGMKYTATVMSRTGRPITRRIHGIVHVTYFCAKFRLGAEPITVTGNLNMWSTR
jgi:hypothetical protein